MKYLIMLLLLLSNSYSFNFVAWEMNADLNKKNILGSNAHNRQFLNGYFDQNEADFSIIYGMNSFDAIYVVLPQEKRVELFNASKEKDNKMFYGIVSKTFDTSDYSIHWYPDTFNVWKYRPLMLYIPLYELYIVIIYTNQDEAQSLKQTKYSLTLRQREIADLDNVLEYFSTQGANEKNRVIVGNFGLEKRDIKNLVQKNIKEEDILFDKRCTIKHRNTGNFNCNIITQKDVLLTIDKSVIQKSLLHDSDFVDFVSNYYPIYIKKVFR